MAVFSVIQWGWIGHDSLLKGCLVGINDFLLVSLLRKGCVVVMGVGMLVLGLQRRVFLR